MDRFVNTRLRIERLHGGDLGGWFVGTNGDALIVELSAETQLAVGERVKIHAVCGDCRTEFESTHLATLRGRAIFEAPGYFCVAPRQQMPRYRCPGARVSLTTHKGVFRAEDVDVSVGGFGFTCATAMDVGETGKVTFRLPDFEGAFEVECRHCRVVPEEGYRIGVSLTKPDRMLSGKWMKYLDSLQDQAA